MSGRGKSAKTLATIAAAIKILEEIQPATVRAVCYRLFVLNFTTGMQKSPTNIISRLLVEQRELGAIPWEYIVDETREAETIASWDNPQALLKSAERQYRKDHWATQPRRVEVWSEKGTVRGTLAPVLRKYGVTFRVMHGYGSATALNDIAEDSMSRDATLEVLYVGDWDPSGLHMSEVDLPARLERYGADVELNRVALTAADVAKMPRKTGFDVATKSKDPRYKWYVENYGRRCWELDALSPVTLRDRVEVEIKKRIDVDRWNHSLMVEAVEIGNMKTFLENMPTSISGQANKYRDGKK